MFLTRFWLPAALAILAVAGIDPAIAADEPAQSVSAAATLEAASELQVASVWVDGRRLFRIAGLALAFPAEARAAKIAERIEALAADPAADASKLRVGQVGEARPILYGDTPILAVTGPDAALMGLDADSVAQAYRQRVVDAIAQYRAEREPARMREAAIRLVAAFAVAAILIALAVWGLRAADLAFDRRFQHRIQTVGIQSFQIVRAEQIRRMIHRSIAFLRFACVAVVLYLLLNYGLSLFPWTRRAGAELLSFVTGPLRSIGGGLLAHLPNVAFLVVLAVIVRFLLRLMRLFFESVGKGQVALRGFEPEWADPTYKLLRLVAIIFALVVAYPYIPGSGTDAFKGLSIFVGVVFSLASTTAIANIVAGYALIYRGAFKSGDRIRVGDVVGIVIRSRLQGTHLRTAKNEEVVVPNAQLINGTIVNYSSLAGSGGVITSVVVGIGYETPWRQVEAMLMLAAGRTEGVSRDAPPFVWHRELGDFCVSYELNVHVRDADAVERIRTALSRNVLDAFNEYGVQIMTPAYERDPAEPKVVAPGDWHLPPAAPPEDAEKGKR